MDLVIFALALIAVLFLLGLLVAGAARSRANRQAVARVTMPQRSLTSSAVARISGLLRDGKTIEAIKVYREQTGERLAQAHAAIQRWDSVGQVGHVDEAYWNRIDLTVRSLMVTEDKIRAIKWVREETGLGLAEAKALVDRLD